MKYVFRVSAYCLVALVAIATFVACSNGGGGSSLARKSGDSSDGGCDGTCENQSLSKEDVESILRQAVAGAQQINLAATIAVTDRVGNVLGVYAMDGAPDTTTFSTPTNSSTGGFVGQTVSAAAAAISKAGTAAYLSTQGNAFSTRTVSQLVQENFVPGESFQPSGPLFGVQFSQLVCSDVPNLNPDLAAGLTVGAGVSLQSGLVGPRPLPLGLAADTGGIPIYKNGDIVGGIGVELNGRYSFDPVITDVDDDPEERIALTGTVGGFETPAERAANQIFVLGNSLRFSDLNYADLEPLPSDLPPLKPDNIVSVAGYARAGSAFAGVDVGDPQSGIAIRERGGVITSVLVDGNGNPRFPSTSGTSQGGLELTIAEVDALLDSAVATAARARSGVRAPRDSQVHASVWVVDLVGSPLGFVRTFDAPIFGIDVALQKARTAVFFSSAGAGDRLIGANFQDAASAPIEVVNADLLNGAVAFSGTSLEELARPFFPNGVNGNPPGPFSLPFPGSDAASGETSTWNPFNIGLQFDLIANQYTSTINGNISGNCAANFGQGLNNGVQFLPGSVPLYRDGVLIGGLGVSGDGVDQDDLVAFFSSSRQGLDFIGQNDIGDPVLGFNAPQDIRADALIFVEQGLRYVNCPEAPFRGTSFDGDVCDDSAVVAADVLPEETTDADINTDVVVEQDATTETEEAEAVEETPVVTNAFTPLIGNYNCNGSCGGVTNFELTVTGERTILINPFGVNGAVTFAIFPNIAESSTTGGNNQTLTNVDGQAQCQVTLAAIGNSEEVLVDCTQDRFQSFVCSDRCRKS